ncbi:MAG: hypothetical protein K6U08_00525 [Firmicutes bacterium]|nr:hypothetical protein [Bacillota bacterium]
MGYRVRPLRSPQDARGYSWPAVLVGILLFLVGLAVVVWWVDYDLRGNLPQGLWTVQNGIYVVFVQAADGALALLALVGGLGLVLGRGWGMATALAALGATLYAAVARLGWCLRNWPSLTPVFLGLLAFALMSFLALHYSRRL